MPYCIGLQRQQLQDLQQRSKRSGCPKAKFIYYAIRRWKRGDFCIPEEDPKEKDIVPITIWRKVDLQDWQVRCILRKHFETPDKKIQQELQHMDQICDELMKLYTSKPYIIEDNDEP